MHHTSGRTRPLARTGALVAVLAIALLGVTSCQNAKAGARCKSGFAQQGSYVLACKNGRWTRLATKAAVARAFIAIANAKKAADAAGGGGGGTPSSAGFSAPDAPLPDDATCAAAVQPAAEIRARNNTPNHTPGVQKNLTQPYPLFARVDGNFTGTTDEIIQWAACKWGFDADVLRAQIVVESWWDQNAVSGWQSDATQCVPGHGIGADPGHAGQCPLFSGLLALRYTLFQNAYPESINSTAYDLDYNLAYWRACYTGQMTWFNSVERGAQYGAGDAWGCVGSWNAGRWHTATADNYVALVQQKLAARTWTTPSFINS